MGRCFGCWTISVGCRTWLGSRGKKEGRKKVWNGCERCGWGRGEAFDGCVERTREREVYDTPNTTCVHANENKSLNSPIKSVEIATCTLCSFTPI